MAQTSQGPGAGKPRSRLGLFLPFILLVILAVAWSGLWFWMRGRAVQEIDAWLAREAAGGRNWTCADRSVTGYPFRLELRCSAVTLARSDGGFRVGPLTAVVQVYQPMHGLIEVAGPFHAEQGDLVGDVTWTSLEGSFHGSTSGFVRASLVVDQPKGSVRGGAPGPVDFAARHLELHARPTPGRFESEGAVDISLRLANGRFPQLDAVVGNAEPASVALDATLEQATRLGTGTIAHELEIWRQAGGRLDLALGSLEKGDRRLQANGAVGLDEAHRPAGRFDVRAAGLDALVGQIMGQRLGAEKGALIGNLVGRFLGGLQRGQGEAGAGPEGNGASAKGDPALAPLPPVKLADGRLFLGPFAVPNVVLPPLY
ncbi:DUF2125 domain-containing protein [Methylobacterium organophilum]|uniref:DUF2125 domain-containing protein n=1 Tax=Methylobacterium organophilum TaxID=410 RepID=A0ABQ4T8M1_METOR|nr:DUF2125 domain-containing protein [Methylobacterium organophilum]GJE28032.1 hypothetical protein LKMONMHP_2896 [Methylobacterium organophilum]